LPVVRHTLVCEFPCQGPWPGFRQPEIGAPVDGITIIINEVLATNYMRKRAGQ